MENEYGRNSKQFPNPATYVGQHETKAAVYFDQHDVDPVPIPYSRMDHIKQSPDSTSLARDRSNVIAILSEVIAEKLGLSRTMIAATLTWHLTYKKELG